MGSFDKIILMGFGKIAQDIFNFLKFEHENITVLETEKNPFSTLEGVSLENNSQYDCIIERSEISRWLLANITPNSLIISANNNYIFSNKILQKDVTIVNFHNALLPKYKGRNAPSWAIYYGEKESGITWHYVDEGVDTGQVILQKTILINNNETALSLTLKAMKAGFESFKQIYGSLSKLDKSTKNTKDKNLETGSIFYSKDIPNNGKIDINDDIDKISRTLRASDYGPFKIFPTLLIKNDLKSYRLRKYSIKEGADKEFRKIEDASKLIIANKKQTILLDVEEVEYNE